MSAHFSTPITPPAHDANVTNTSGSAHSVLVRDGIWIKSDRHHLPSFSPADHDAVIALVSLMRTPAPASASRGASALPARRVPTRTSTGKVDGRRKKSARSSAARTGKERQEMEDSVREQWKAQAKAIEVSRGTQANDFQLFVMNWVFREVTPYPDETWMALVSIGVKRSLSQVKHWFSNQRQVATRSSAGLQADLQAVAVDDRSMRLRKMALADPHVSWSDAKFKAALDHVLRVQREKFEAQLAASR